MPAIKGIPFQSLEGIWGFWNFPLDRSLSSWYSVSIPGRDLGVLELEFLPPGGGYPTRGVVSIPGRDLGVLERRVL